MKSTQPISQSAHFTGWLGYILMGSLALLGAMGTASNPHLVQWLENQVQTLFFELRGAVAPPENIVILAIDNDSFKQAENYFTNPKTLKYLEPLKQWPWKRAAYAEAIAKLMGAGAKSVALDIILDQPSRYGAKDDQQLQQVLQRYAGRVTLGAVYENLATHQGAINQLTLPNRVFWTKPTSIGSINYPLAADGRIHRFASEYPKLLKETLGKKKSDEFNRLAAANPSFDEAVLSASGIRYPRPKGDSIYFHGSAGTFVQVPFWYVLDPVNWNNYLQKGRFFKDKIVLIGSTATELKDFYPAPFSQTWLYPEPIAGIEIHANAIATLMQGKAIAPAIPNASLQGLCVFLGILGSGILLSQPKHLLTRCAGTVGILVAWGSISYITFTYGQRTLPTAVPMMAIAFGSVSYLATEAINAQKKKHQLRQTLARYATSPIVQEIISQQDELKDLLPKQKAAPTEKILAGRYQILNILGIGGFGETFIARDSQRPGNPLCVVKQLKPARTNPKNLQLARRLFAREAEVLAKVGQHPQIPQLLAYFEENQEFYLVQEFIPGHSLDQELLVGKPLPEAKVVNILIELLQILEFVHQNGVIHRDIKPNNIIRRQSDNKLVLIDFGAVKEINTQLLNTDGNSRFTVGIGTLGYAPNEQCAGRPHLNSDIYAIGIIGIQGLTGCVPSQLQQDLETGEILWSSKAKASAELIAILSKMIRYDFRQRYQTVLEAKEALLAWQISLPPTTNIPISQNWDEPTQSWTDTSEINPLEE